MSKPVAGPRSTLIQTLLFASVIFLGLQIIMGGLGPKPEDKRTTEQILAEMRTMNAQILDRTIAREAPLLRNKVGAEKLTNEERDAKNLESVLLVASTQFSGGMKLDDWARIDQAYLTLQAERERFEKTELWDQPFKLAPIYNPETDAQLSPQQIAARPLQDTSAQQLYDALVTELSARNQSHLIMGIVPGYALIDFLVNLTGAIPWLSYTIASLILAIIVRAFVWPLAQRQLMWGRQMSQLAPYVKEIQEKYKDKKTGQITDPQAFQAETMKLYGQYGINPVAGCLPALVQMPLFLLVYQCMLHYRFEFTKGTFLWIHPNSGTFLGIPLAPNLGERDYILVFIYGLSMIATSLLMPVSDPTNAKQQRMLGVGIAAFFSIVMFFWIVPSAFVLYWIFTNVLSTAQSLRAYRLPMPPLEKKMASNGAVLPVNPIAPTNGDAKSSYLGKTGTPKSNKPKKRK